MPSNHLLLLQSGGPLLPASPDLPSLPPMTPGPTWPGGGFGGWETGLEAQQAPRAEWVGQTPSTPLPCLSCSLLASLLCPQDRPGQEGISEGIEPSPRAGQTSPAIGQGKRWACFPTDPSPRGSPQAWEPLPPLSHPLGRWSCPASISPPLSVPPRPTGSLGGSSHVLGHWGPPPASSRCHSSGEM